MSEKSEKKEKAKSLARWDPLAELELFESWDPFREIGLSSRLRRLLGDFQPLGGGGRLVPALDLTEDDERYVVTVELPGIRKEDVHVETHDHVMTIRGEKKCEREEKKERSRWTERSYGSFSRSFSLPSNALTERVAASFRDGVLRVEIPKAEETKPKVISIKS